MANHALPTTSSTYANFVLELDDRMDDAAKGYDPAAGVLTTAATNLPTNTIRWNSNTGFNYWEKYNGTSWAPLTSSYSININGTVGGVTPATGAFTTLSSSGIASLGASSTVGTVPIVTTTGSQTLTGKTLTTPIISTISNNAIILTLPTTVDTLVGRSTIDTLTNKTLTAPKVVSGGFIADANGNELVVFTQATTPVNAVTIANAASAVNPSITASGGDTNIGINLVPKGTGKIQVNGIEVVSLSAAQTLTNKILTTPTISSILNTGTLTLPTSTDTLVGRATTDSLTNKTISTGSTWNGNLIAGAYGGTGNSAAFVQGGVAYGSSTTVLSNTGAGTTYQVLQSNGTSAPTWANLDISLHIPSSSYKSIVRLATTSDLAAATFAAGVITGYDDTTTGVTLTTTAASTTITASSTSTIKVGAVISVATLQVAAGTAVASITSATTLIVTNRVAITTTGITGTGTVATATFAAQTYAPYAIGATIVISGTTPTTYSGSFVVTACTTTSVSWSSVETVAATVQGPINFTIAAGTAIPTTFKQTIAALSIDGSSAALNDRILVKDQSTLGALNTTDAAKMNGIYYVSTLGTTTIPWVLTRVADANSSSDIDSGICNVSAGTANGGKTFKTTFTGINVLDTTVMQWNKLVDVAASYQINLPTTAVGFDLSTDTKTTMLATGNLADLAINSLATSTIRSMAASTYTRASTLYIAGAPVASTNATITTPYAMYIATGNSYLGGTLTTPSTINGLTLSSTGVVSAAATALNLTTGTTGILTLDSGTSGAINIGTSATAKTITLGNATGATGLVYNAGTSGHTITAHSAVTNTVGPATVFSHDTSGVHTAGIGTRITLRTETSTGNYEDGVYLDSVTTDITAATEDFDFIVSTMSAGLAPVKRLKVNATGTEVTGLLTVTANASVTGTLSATGAVTGTSFNSITALSSSLPVINGTATIGVSTTVARSDHIHPTDTTRSPLAGSASITTVGTIATGTWSASFGAVSGANLTTLNATNLSSGTVASARGVSAGSATPSFVGYNGTTSLAGQFDGGTTTPVGTNRLNYSGYFYPTAINLNGIGDTTTAATHYFVEAATDGFVRPKTLANVRTEIVTAAAIAAVSPTAVPNVVILTTSDITGVNGGTYVLTGASNITVFLPVGPAIGSQVRVINKGTSNLCTIGNNGEFIMGLAESMTIDATGIGITLFYINTTYGWSII